MQSGSKGKEDLFPAKVIGVLGQNCVMINRGSKHGVTKGQKFIIYGFATSVSEGPVTVSVKRDLKESRIQKGSGTVVYVDDKVASIQSAPHEFYQPVIGDKAKPIP